MRNDNFNASHFTGRPETMILDDTELGDIKIHESVIASLARRAALNVPGVSRLAGSSLVDNLAEMVGSRRMQSRAVAINLGEKNDVAIEMKVILKFGFCIPEVAAQIQKEVISMVEKTSGMSVTSVNVLVQEIEEGKDAAEEDDSLPLD
jgi:uncharacterized alkaline shock family protein YloU